MPRAQSFTFYKYKINTKRSIVTFSYKVKFKYGITKTFKDKLYFSDILPNAWQKIPKETLDSTLEALLLILGINYWCVFPTNKIYLNNFSLTKEQAEFWDTIYLNGLGEFFYKMKIDFHNLIKFPFDNSKKNILPNKLNLSKRALLLNGAGKDSILSAEILKELNIAFDFFAFSPTPAHNKIAEIAKIKTLKVKRKKDPMIDIIMSIFGISYSYPSVTTFTFTAVLLAELIGYNSIVFSNEKSADFGNLNYLGLNINHQWCKSTEAEKLVNDYIQKYISPDISTNSLLRKYSELEIVEKFVNYPQYLNYFTSCNTYFWLPYFSQKIMRKSYWCKKCPKCVFMFACFSAYIPKDRVINIFGANLYKEKRLLPIFKNILGVDGHKPLDCVGEPEEMILAMNRALERKEYDNDFIIKYFRENFSRNILA